MKGKLIFAFLFFSLITPLNNALAVCPVCTVAVGAGLGFSRWLGVDDAVTGVWIGGILVSSVIWMLSWIKAKNWSFKGDSLVIAGGMYGVVLIPLYWKGLIGNPFNTFCYVDKVILGVLAGSAVFLLATKLNTFLKNKNNGKAYFPFQKVALPLIFLLASSILFYFLTKCFT